MEYYSADTLLRYFENEIVSSSDKEIEAILRDVVAVKSKELAKIELEVKQQVALSQGVRLKEIKDAQRAEINRLIAAKNQNLATRRQAIADEVFAAVRARLAAFAASPAYAGHVANKAALAQKSLGSSPLAFYVAPEDAAAKAVLADFASDATVTADPHIRLGGFRVVAVKSGLEVDETFDARLEKNRTWFYAHSQLFIRH